MSRSAFADKDIIVSSINTEQNTAPAPETLQS